MDVGEKYCWHWYVKDRGVIVAPSLVDLAGMAGSQPLSNVPDHAMPHKKVTHKTLWERP